MVGLPEAKWSKDEDDKSHLHGSSIQDPKQRTISDFMTLKLILTDVIANVLIASNN
jgi:hypothetical protein